MKDIEIEIADNKSLDGYFVSVNVNGSYYFNMEILDKTLAEALVDELSDLIDGFGHDRKVTDKTK